MRGSPLRRTLRLGPRVIAAVALISCTGGCSGRASLHLIPLGNRAIDASGPLISRVSPTECYYWLNDEGELCIAMRGVKRAAFDRRFDQEFIASFVLDAPPAGEARNYRVSRRTVRMRSHAGFTHTRSASLNGIVGVWNYDRTTLRGRFRFTVKQQSYSVLVGWGGNTQVLYVGEFSAIPHPMRGEKLLARTEEDAMNRQGAAHPAAESPSTPTQ